MQDKTNTSSPDPGDRDKQLLRVPLGYEDLEHDKFTPVALTQVLKMISSYSDKPKQVPAMAQAKQAEAGQEEPDTLACWFCVDVFLKLMGIQETEQSLKARNAMDPAVTGVRIYFARSGNCNTVVMLSTEKQPETQKEAYGAQAPAVGKTRSDDDRIGPNNRVVYVDKDHNDPDGGSLCPPPRTNTLQAATTP